MSNDNVTYTPSWKKMAALGSSNHFMSFLNSSVDLIWQLWQNYGRIEKSSLTCLRRKFFILSFGCVFVRSRSDVSSDLWFAGLWRWESERSVMRLSLVHNEKTSSSIVFILCLFLYDPFALISLSRLNMKALIDSLNDVEDVKGNNGLHGWN